MRFGLIITGLADPRSESGRDQFGSQSFGSKKVGEVRVELSLTTASLRVDPAQGIALPVATNTLLVTSSTTTPPAAQIPAPPDDGVWKTGCVPVPLAGTATTYP